MEVLFSEASTPPTIRGGANQGWGPRPCSLHPDRLDVPLHGQHHHLHLDLFEPISSEQRGAQQSGSRSLVSLLGDYVVPPSGGAENAFNSISDGKGRKEASDRCGPQRRDADPDSVAV